MRHFAARHFAANHFAAQYFDGGSGSIRFGTIEEDDLVGPENLAAGIMARWLGSSVRAICPGGLWYGRVREDAQAPYARLNCAATGMVWLSDKRYIRSFDAKVEAWGDKGPADVSWVRSAIEAAIGGMVNGSVVPNSIKVVDVRPAATGLTIESGVRNSNDVCLLTMNWQFKIEGRFLPH